MSVPNISATAAVANGAALLDRTRPGWAQAIDLPLLDIENCHRCMLGQIFGKYEKGVEAFGFTDPFDDDEGWGWAVQHGFAPNWPYDRQSGPHLNDAWRSVIQERRAQ